MLSHQRLLSLGLFAAFFLSFGAFLWTCDPEESVPSEQKQEKVAQTESTTALEKQNTESTTDASAPEQTSTPEQTTTETPQEAPLVSPKEATPPEKIATPEPQPEQPLSPEQPLQETSPEPTPSAFATLHLYDEDTNDFLIEMKGLIDLKPYETRNTLNLAIKSSDPRIRSVRFQFDNLPARQENTPAYTVFVSGDQRDQLTKGTHTVTYTLYDQPSATGTVLYRATNTFTIQETISTPTTPGGQGLPKDPYQIPPDPTFTKTKNVNQTIVITKPGVYDYQGVLHIWTGSGSCNQTENQPHIMRIAASNVTVKNFAYRNAPDGIHIATCGTGQGNTCSGSISNITLDNVTGWACEDALTTGKGTSKITIRNSFFLGNPNSNYRDKCLQINFGDDLVIEYTMFKNCKRPIRFKSGSQIRLQGNRFYLFQHAVKGDTYSDISGIVPNQSATVTGNNNHFQEGSFGYYVEGKINVTSTSDIFHKTNKTHEAKDGANVQIR